MRRLVCIVILCLGVEVLSLAQQKDIILPEVPDRAHYVDYSVKRSGWWCAAQLSGAFATTEDDMYARVFQFDFINGYRFSEFLKVGLGISPRIYASGNDFPLDDDKLLFGIYSLPVYADIRGNFVSQEDTMFAPYWNVDFGYAINEGVYLSPGVGLKYGGIRHNLLIGINYTLQGHSAGEFNKPIHLLGIRLGYEF